MSATGFMMRPLLIVLIALPVVLVAALLAAAAGRGLGMLKKQGVAWGLTLLMVLAAIGIGYAKAPAGNTPESQPDQAVPSAAPVATVPPAVATKSFVWDNAKVLSDRTIKTLEDRNQRLWREHSVTIGVVTCNYGGDDLYSYALQCAEDMELGGYDFIVVLDISGDNYWLIQGAELVQDFTDADCSDYAYDYMEEPFARGDYDSAVLQLTERLETWYGVYYWLS